ncbi:GAF and ANTAR domain-containing protein [Actinomycetospora endophytica]|uniref:GAF and ANTAR domain-containing protein n=1 Tax=Actinomycetospora endophytica TaxID=2291215 RepID=A0ABS8PDE3_9PSEU|nr:GAF and ANTAR domain-containing protein [Actinomycetospora endophytica]MCD2196263.1 GAF and ANTAR domain-containing protein [Actinomycetospora endophytica]
MDTSHDLTTALRRAAHDLTAKRSIRDLDQTLSNIVAAAVSTVPAADAGGISMTDSGQVVSRNPTSDAVTKLDQLQGELQEGPCVTAIVDPPEDGSVLVRDLAGEDAARWPRFAPHATESGYRSMLSSELHTGGGMRAALNLYAAGPDAFDAESRLTAGLFALQAAMLLYGSEQTQSLQRAVDSRDLIGQAKGILMERFRVDDDAAFQMLVRSSQETNMKLAEVARWVHDETVRRSGGHVVDDADIPGIGR